MRKRKLYSENPAFLFFAILISSMFVLCPNAFTKESKAPVFQTQIMDLSKEITEICPTGKLDSCRPIRTVYIDQALATTGLQPLGISYISDKSELHSVAAIFYEATFRKKIDFTILTDNGMFAKETYVNFSGSGLLCTEELGLSRECYFINSKELLKYCLEKAISLEDKATQKELAEHKREEQSDKYITPYHSYTRPYINKIQQEQQ